LQLNSNKTWQKRKYRIIGLRKLLRDQNAIVRYLPLADDSCAVRFRPKADMSTLYVPNR
jgi:hypothetical protein